MAGRVSFPNLKHQINPDEKGSALAIYLVRIMD